MTKTKSMRTIIISLLMFAMIFCGFAGLGAITASAADNVAYVDAKGVAQTPVTATDITASTTTWSNGWYYVSSDVTISSRVTVSGTVNLILGDGMTLTASKGIGVSSGNTLNIWAQSGGTGTLIANGEGASAAIGGTYNSDQNIRNAGTITINGGNITANGSDGSGGRDPAAIGGAGDNNTTLTGGTGGNITINGGNVTATGGGEGAGIGGAPDAGWLTGQIIIKGGVITANTLGGSPSGGGVEKITVSGCPVILCTGYRNTQHYASWGSGILFTDNGKWAKGTVFGNPTLDRDVSIGTLGHEKNVTIPSDKTLTVPNGFTFSTGGGGTVTNEGTIKIENGGTFSAAKLVNNGNIQNDGNLKMTASWSGDISVNNGTITNGENGLITSNQQLTGTGTVVNGVKFNLTNLETTSDNDFTHDNTDYSVTLTKDGYVLLPENLTVKVKGVTLTEGTGYTLSKGTITIPAAQIKGNIEITATGVEGYYVTYTLSNLTSDGSEAVIKGNNLEFALASADGYLLPESITVKIGDKELTEGYTYDASTGAITVASTYISDNIEIIASGKPCTDHTYDHSCDTRCNKCNLERTELVHVYTDCTDADCNNDGCSVTRTAQSEHSYTDCTDADCNNDGCSVTREAQTDHAYDADCTDTTCNSDGCSVTRTAQSAHSYTDCTDTDCNNDGCTVMREAQVHTPDADDGDCTTAITCSVCGTVTAEGADKHSYENGVCTICNTFGATLAGSNLTLDGNIGLNFYFELDSSILESETAFVRFTLENGRVIEIPVSEGVENTTAIAGKTLHVFTCEVYATQMADTVTAQVVVGENASAEYTHSVVDYANAIISAESGTYSAETVALVKAMLNYGAYAQINFNYNTDNLANAALLDAEKDLSSVTAETLAAYQASGMTVEGIGTFAGSNLVLDSETAIKVYFKPADGVDINSLTFTVGAETLTPVQSGEYYVISITNIAANALDNEFEITVTNGSTEGKFTCSVYAYCYNVLNDTTGTYTEAHKNVVKALYLYNVAANNYK